MNIAYIINYYLPAWSFGGPVKSVSSICAAMKRSGHDVRVLTTNIDAKGLLDVPVNREVTQQSVPVTYYQALPVPPRSFFVSPSLVQGVRERIAEFDVAILDLMWTQPLPAVARACDAASVPYLVPLRGQLLPWAMRQRPLAKKAYLNLFGRRILNKAAALWCTHESEEKPLRSLGLDARVIVVPNGLDLREFGDVCINRSVSSPAKLLFAGRLHKKKRPDIAVEVLAGLCRQHVDCQLTIVGPDEQGLAPVLTQMARQLGCVDRLQILGAAAPGEIAALMRTADILLVPSEPESENFGMVMLEAMALGAPAIVSEGVALGSVAERYGAACVVSCDGSAFVRAAAALLADDLRRRRMAESARRLVEDTFDIDIVASKLIDEVSAAVARAHAA